MITTERLKELLRYDPLTGEFFWLKKPSPRVNIGDRAGHIDNKGYWRVKIDGRAYLQSRLVWLYMTGTWPARFIDHKNQDRAANRWENLREANDQQNKANSRGWAKYGKGVNGLRKSSRNPYAAVIRVNGKTIYLGCFPTAEKANAAYFKAAKLHFGEFARSQ
jgi:hypothetical protein